MQDVRGRVPRRAPVRKPRDEEDDRPPSRFRRPADAGDDEPPRRDDFDDRPRRKANPMLVIGSIVGVVVLLTGGVVAAVLLSRGNKKKGEAVDPGDVVMTPAKSCPLESPRRTRTCSSCPTAAACSAWSADRGGVQEDVGLRPVRPGRPGRRVGRIELKGVEEPKAFSLSPDGKHLLVAESRRLRLGDGPPADGLVARGRKNLTPDKWAPFPRAGGANEDLYRVESVAPDAIVAVGTYRSIYRYQVPSFEVTADRASGADEALGRTAGPVADNVHRLQYQVAFSADRKRLAVWNGNGYTVVDSRGGAEAFATPRGPADGPRAVAGRARPGEGPRRGRSRSARTARYSRPSSATTSATAGTCCSSGS